MTTFEEIWGNAMPHTKATEDKITAGKWFRIGQVATENPAPSGQTELPGCKASEIEAQRILIAAAVAHRACYGTEHDPENGKLHGYCVVCGIAWPCETAKKFM